MLIAKVWKLVIYIATKSHRCIPSVVSHPASNEACAGFVGIPDLDATEANLYPNPARDQITIEAVNMTRLHIVNYVGQVVYDAEFDNTQSRDLNTANYQSGVYVARIYTEAGIITKRFVINR